MKSEIELLGELRNSLDAYAASSLRLERVNASDYKLVDHTFYEHKQNELISLGFNPVGDFNVITGHASDNSMRCFIRALISHDGCYVAACYHPRPKFLLGLLARIFSGKLGKVTEIETEFSDDTILVSTTCPKMRLFDPPPLLLRGHYPEKTQTSELLNIHKNKVAVYLSKNPGVYIRKVSDTAGLERLQARDHDIKAVYRKMIGGLSAEEIRRFSLFGKKRANELKGQLDALDSNPSKIINPASTDMPSEFTAPIPPVLNSRKAIVTANPSIASAARWFWWIAGLSVINSVLIHSGSETSFLAGLGFTLVADAVFQAYKPVAFVIDTLAVSFFFVIGLMALRGYRWAFLVGGILYALDACIYLALQGWLSVAFHGWALFSIWTGGTLLHRTVKNQQIPPQLPSSASITPPVNA